MDIGTVATRVSPSASPMVVPFLLFLSGSAPDDMKQLSMQIMDRAANDLGLWLYPITYVPVYGKADAASSRSLNGKGVGPCGLSSCELLLLKQQFDRCLNGPRSARLVQRIQAP